jgi:hypothetical protein
VRFGSILNYQEFGKPLSREERERSADAPAPLATLAASEIRRRVNDLDVQLTRRIYELEREQNADVHGSVLTFLERWSEDVQRAREDVEVSLAQHMSNAGIVPNGEYGAVVEPLPSTQSSNRASCFPHEAQRFVYVFMGRMLHALKRHDEWQISVGRNLFLPTAFHS